MFSDSVDREAAWLSTTGDTLPDLTTLFQTIQARQPRTPNTNKTSLYVLRQPTTSFHIERYAAPRSIATTMFMLRCYWPLRNGTGSAEDEQLKFEQAIDAVLTRVMGLLGDKTHGGRFLSVAEDRTGINVQYEDPLDGVKAGIFAARIIYSGDDPDFAN